MSIRIFISPNLCQSGFVSIQICINPDFFIKKWSAAKAILEEFFPQKQILNQPVHNAPLHSLLTPVCEGCGKGFLGILKIPISEQNPDVALPLSPTTFSSRLSVWRLGQSLLQNSKNPDLWTKSGSSLTIVPLYILFLPRCVKAAAKAPSKF